MEQTGSSTIAGNPAEVGSVDGIGAAALFAFPRGLAADATGTLYVADTGNNTIRKGVFSQFAFSRSAPYTPPPLTGALTVTLDPPEAYGQWRFPWELEWHGSGTTATHLPAGSYALEFRSVPGWLAIPPSLSDVVIQSGGVSITNRYYPTLGSADTSSGAGTLTVNLGVNPPAGAGWQLLGATPFLASGFTTNLLPGTYLIEFAAVSGRVKPPSQAVQVSAGSRTSLSVNYFLAQTPPSGVLLPFPVDLSNDVNDETVYPFGFNGQLQSDNGYGSGVAVEDNVVLTAAHLVFNDQTLSYVNHAYWFFRRDSPLNEPLPQEARAFYLLDGYAAQRTNDLASGYSPDQSTPPSRNLDVAAVYFLDSVAAGGHGGYLPSDAVPNTWLSSTALKMLVGYPVDGSQFGDASIEPGKMYQTDPQPYPLNLAQDPVSGQQQVYIAPWLLSHPGNSGGPVYVQLNGYYYPAAVYLGTLFSGAQPYGSVVRAIDSSVTNLIQLAASQGDRGTNNTGGGVIRFIPNLAITAKTPGYVQVNLGPPAAVKAGGGWRLDNAPTNAYGSDPNYTLTVVSSNAVAVVFKPIPGWNLPANQTVTVTPGQITVINATYTAVAPPRLVARRASATAVELSWPTSAANFTLQHSDPSLAPLQWNAVPATPAPGPVSYTLQVPIADASRLYRLIRP
jgi:V8-like Glu-specific endopeptidase